ncbi:MAG: D-alanine--D-alanine ligase [Alphaproteobacteria bacterium]|nr:D-alanine--D-alanine ligase [Alphaproteobacteria bacterium]
MSKIKNKAPVLVLEGGLSAEREISFKSAASVQNALHQLGYSVLSFDMKKGIDALKTLIEREKPFCIFNALHGGWGENGHVPALLNMLKIPYTHSGLFASALGMNKTASKAIASSLDIDIPKGILSAKEWILKNEKSDFDAVIKPNQEGSSVGVVILKKCDPIPTSLKEEALNGKSFVVEEYIKGREFSVAVTDEEVLGMIELIPQDGFYDYEHKYRKGKTKHVIPTDLSVQTVEKLCDAALKMHRFLGCKGVSRSDFRYDEELNRIVFLEINTHPGMTDLSLVPEIALQKGISYNELVEYLITKADFEK